MGSRRIQTVIFDVDGTLVDSNDFHARSWVEALAEQGYDVSFDDIRRRIGMGGDNLLPEVIGQDKDSPVGKKAGARRREIFVTQYLPRVRAFPQVTALFHRVHGAGLKAAIASSSEREELDRLLQVAGVEGLADTVTSSSDAKKSKPDPAPVNVALTKSGTAPGRAVMVGDTPFDIEAARKAGVGTVALRCGGFSDDDLKGALAVYDDPADLLAHFDTSPLGQPG